MVDEKALRKPEFDEKNSVPIMLLDGQSWWFRKPWIDLRPAAEGVESRGADFDDLLDQCFPAEPMSFRKFAAALFKLARAMLAPNYDLPPEVLPEILAFQPDDEANRATWKAIVSVARGSTVDVPKPMTSGSPAR